MLTSIEVVGSEHDEKDRLVRIMYLKPCGLRPVKLLCAGLYGLSKTLPNSTNPDAKKSVNGSHSDAMLSGGCRAIRV